MLGAVVARGASVQRLALVVMCQQGRSSWRLLPNQCRRETSGRASGSSSSNPATPGNAQAKAPVAGPQSNFCRVCGGRMQQLVPPGEHTLRSVCGEW